MLETLIGGGLIGGAANVIGGLLDFGANKQANKQAKELAKYQYDLNMNAWREQTDYNRPINQVARLKEAGLNPQLAYGNGTQAGNATPAPQYQAPTIQKYTGAQQALNGGAATALSIFQANLAAKKQKEELKLLESQRDYNVAMRQRAQAEALYITSKKGGQDIANRMAGFQQSVQKETYNREVEQWQAEQDLRKQQFQLASAQINKLNAETRLVLAQTISESFKQRLMQAQAANQYAQARYANSQANLVDQQVNVFGENFRLNQSLTLTQIDKMSAEIKQLVKTGNLTQANINKITKDLDWYTADKIKSYIESVVGMQTQFYNVGAKYIDAFIPG